MEQRSTSRSNPALDLKQPSEFAESKKIPCVVSDRISDTRPPHLHLQLCRSVRRRDRRRDCETQSRTNPETYSGHVPRATRPDPSTRLQVDLQTGLRKSLQAPLLGRSPARFRVPGKQLNLWLTPRALTLHSHHRACAVNRETAASVSELSATD